MNQDKILNRSFFATYLQGVIVMILVAMYFVHAPILLEMLEMSESKFAIGMVFFGISNVITNQLSTRFLIPKIGTTNCLVIARLMYSLLPFFIFYFSNYYFFLFISIIWGVAIGIQAPSLFTQVAIVESRTKKILNPIFKSSFAVGSLIGAGLASLFLGLEINPKKTFFILGILVFLSSITMFYWGLPRNYDIVNNSPKFTWPSKIILFYASINMMVFASMGIIINWSSLWLINDIKSPIYLAGFIIIFFNIGEISSNMLASRLIKTFNEKIVGPYFAMLGSIILFISILTMNIYFIFVAIIFFGFLTSNIIPIVYRVAIKISSEPIPVTISHVSSIAFSGLIFGPAIVGLSAEKFGLTFNMYALSVVFFCLSFVMVILMNKNIMVGVEGIEPTPPK